MKKRMYKIPCTIPVILSVTMLVLASCGKTYDLNGFDWEPKLPLSDSVFNREIQVFDLGIDNIPQGHRPFAAQDPLYYSLERLSSVHLGYKNTDRWDIAFGDLYRSAIFPNNKNNNRAYSGTAEGGIMLVEQPYSEVTQIPDSKPFENRGIGLMALGEDYIMGGGYVFYTFFGNPFRPDKIANLYHPDPLIAADANRYLHMMYCLSEDFAKAFPGEYGPLKYKPKPVTILVKTASGNYAKIEMQSFYKGTMDPLQMRRGQDKAVPYFSFRYMIIKKEEKRFGFVARKPSLTIDMTKNTVKVGK